MRRGISYHVNRLEECRGVGSTQLEIGVLVHDFADEWLLFRRRDQHVLGGQEAVEAWPGIFLKIVRI